MITTIVYLHGNKESMWSLGHMIGLRGEALRMFSFACSEVQMKLEIDPTTGLAKIIEVDGRRVV